MTITVTPIQNNQTFGAWLSTTNRLANIISQNTVTTDASIGGSLTTGNAYVNGYFGANYLYVDQALVGGNVSSNGTLNLIANAAFKYSTANLVAITANTTSTTFTAAVNVYSVTTNSFSVTAANTFSVTTDTFSVTGDSTLSGNVTIQNSVDLKSYVETGTNPTISAGVLTLDLSSGTVFSVTLDQNINTLTLTNVPATSGKVPSFALIFTADGTARTVSWPAGFRWSNGNTAPSITSVLDKRDIFTFISTDNGTTWNSLIAGQNI